MRTEYKASIEQLMRRKNWSKAFSLINRQLKKSPMDTWLLAKLSYVCFQLDKYKKSLELMRKAYKISPNDPNIIWDYACVLQELNYDAEAIRIFKRILRKGLHDIVSYSYYKDKRKRALSLINDCRLKIGVGYFALRRGRLAAKWLNLYLRNVDKGIPSLHNKREAVDRLETLENIRLVEKYHDKGQWEQAKSIAKNELRKYPNDVWLLAILSSAYHEQHTYKKAFQIIRKAIKIAPNEPLVMWHYAGTLDTLGNHKKAMHVYKKIIRKGIKRIAFKDTTEGIRWAKSLINDCRYRIALCYLDIGKKPLAIKYMRQHLANRSAIAPSIYPIKKVRRKLKEIMVA